MKDNMRMHARYLDGVHNKEPNVKKKKKRTQDAPMRSKAEIIITAARLIS